MSWRLSGTVPSFASTIFIFSILSVLAAGRSQWPKQLKEPRRIFKFFIELILILYIVDLTMKNVWAPIQKFVSFLCKICSRSLYNRHQGLSIWIASNGYNITRLLVAVLTLWWMMQSLDVTSRLNEWYTMYIFPQKKESISTEPSVMTSSEEKPSRVPIYEERSMSRSRRSRSFEENPFASIDFNMDLRSRARQMVNDHH